VGPVRALFGAPTGFIKTGLYKRIYRVEEYVRIGRRIGGCPAIRAAFEAGELDRTKVRDVLTVANRETEAAWIDRMRGHTNRELERMVRATQYGQPPPDGVPPDSNPMRRIQFEVPASHADIIFQAIKRRRFELGDGGDGVTDGEIFAEICLEDVTRQPAPPEAEPEGGDPYRILVHQCPTCEHATCGDRPLTDVVADEASCDALITDMRPGPSQGTTTHAVPPKARMIALSRHEFCCAVPGCRNRWWLHIHHLRGRKVPNPHHPDNLAPLCPAHHRAVHAGYLGIERLADGTLAIHRRFGVEVSHVGATQVIQAKAGPDRDSSQSDRVRPPGG